MNVELDGAAAMSSIWACVSIDFPNITRIPPVLFLQDKLSSDLKKKKTNVLEMNQGSGD